MAQGHFRNESGPCSGFRLVEGGRGGYRGGTRRRRRFVSKLARPTEVVRATTSTQIANRSSREPGGNPCRSPRDRLSDLVGSIRRTQQSAEPFSDDDTLADIGIASIEMVTLLLAVESEFDIEIPRHEITADVFRSISTIDALIRRLLAESLRS
jgi:acyl carrier protein